MGVSFRIVYCASVLGRLCESIGPMITNLYGISRTPRLWLSVNTADTMAQRG
jgi:hypothetical protein